LSQIGRRAGRQRGAERDGGEGRQQPADRDPEHHRAHSLDVRDVACDHAVVDDQRIERRLRKARRHRDDLRDHHADQQAYASFDGDRCESTNGAHRR